MQKKGDATERRGSTVKYGKIPFRVGWLVKVLWDFACMRVIWKLLNAFA